MSIAQVKTINDVKQFWDACPLFSDEHQGVVGTLEFLEHHEKVIINDIMGGCPDDNFSKYLKRDGSVLDIGCGLGFWVRQFCRQGLDVYACDLSTTAVELTEKSRL